MRRYLNIHEKIKRWEIFKDQRSFLLWSLSQIGILSGYLATIGIFSNATIFAYGGQIEKLHTNEIYKFLLLI